MDGETVTEEDKTVYFSWTRLTRESTRDTFMTIVTPGLRLNALNSVFRYHTFRFAFISLHDDTPAGLVASAAIARFTAREHGLGLDDGSNGGGDAGRHFEDGW